MKVDTQEEFNEFPLGENLRKQCPYGDYSLIRKFPGYCDFASGSRFGTLCEFGEECYFGNGCSFGEDCQFGSYCEFGGNCRFDCGNQFGEGCRFGFDCTFGGWCKFGEENEFSGGNVFGACCECEFGELEKVYSISGFGSVGRSTNFFHLYNGEIYVRCGCFTGTIAEWEKEVKETHGDTRWAKSYLSIGKAVREICEDDL